MQRLERLRVSSSGSKIWRDCECRRFRRNLIYMIISMFISNDVISSGMLLYLHAHLRCERVVEDVRAQAGHANRR